MDFIKKHLSHRLVIILSYLFIILAGVYGLLTRFSGLFYYVEFKGDQVRDAWVYMDMLQGVWPTLGPSSSVGVFSLPPLYYYVVFPFTAFSANPIWQALPNALFSFFSIFLLMYLVYQMLNGISYHRKLLLASFAGFWWSLIFADIYLSAREWNPSPTPFFLMVFVLVAHTVFCDKYKKWQQVCWWIFYGLLIAVLVSLHSTVWLVIPLVALVHSIYYIYQTKKWYLPLVALIVAFSALTPYWLGEIGRGWSNTGLLWDTFTQSSDSQHFFMEKIEHTIMAFAQLGKQVYLVDANTPYLASIFVYGAFLLFVIFYRGNRKLLSLLILIWVFYFYALSNYWGIIFVHYQLLLVPAPIIFVVGFLAYVNLNSRRQLVLTFVLLFFVGFSGSSNLQATYQFAKDISGQDRLMNITDKQQALRQAPLQATLCGAEEDISVYQYLDYFLSHRRLNFSVVCEPGMIAIIPQFSKQHAERQLFLHNNPKITEELYRNTVFSLVKF
ncbi:MAG: hypothetical protein A2233_01870 [Candidatus Kerfeldbacteria bacterium RIFOXYA2_FULL_38_24]|uniref:Glycosyltransferase RgtA/B/C/D-like domain-containing protein n=1 Tax=Candidatus Kerfeldbacteria bacterium RIFOXYB2_FULL_38_14 TaxID=1798547 RepID=A0A1G2BET6_9BACT|nr:MAG: hypothetical protein A2319_04475 [Candidatus Kerfeldbacteria bacterium RIFOXYB2_FULL_38_14]OGY87863.1 MAG: hypothetical protein A2233_01870 [Candidatus Kerfeldbacteria bacterium RIFOXYA2_FULL_38_24]OGY88499.1 MAG: hypothetical protein A2458_01875 [Candidatus Kerfeldbacteria bacterium RIFOXYC2_FULL_38_9]